MTPRQLKELCDAANTRLTPDGLSWPLSLTFNDGTYLSAVRWVSLQVSGGVAQPTIGRLIGHDLGHNELIDISVDDLIDAHLTKGTWKEAVLQPQEVSLERLSMVSHERKHDVVFLVSKSSPIAPLENEVAFCLVTLDPTSPTGTPWTMQEERIAASLIDPSAVVGSKVLVEYSEDSRGLKRAIRIGRVQASSDEA